MSMKTYKAETAWSGDGFLVEGNTRGFTIALDEPEELGGKNRAMSPVELLLNALGGCITICAVAFSKLCRVKLNGLKIDVEGDIDIDGFLGKNPDVRMGFQQIRFKMHFDSPSPREKIDKLVAMIHDRCPVSDTLKGVEVKMM